MRPHAPRHSQWDELVGPFMLSEKVEALLGVSREAVDAMARSRRLLRVISADGVSLFPCFQFDGNHMVPGLPEVLTLFAEDKVDGWTVAGWLRTPDVELGGSPYEVLQRGEDDQVRMAAQMAARSLGS